MSVSAGKELVFLLEIAFVAMNARVSGLKILAW